MKFENTEVWGFSHALRGMRNPMNSWDKSDSKDNLGIFNLQPTENDAIFEIIFPEVEVTIGENDMKLAQKLIRAGAEHRKFMRQIFVAVDITAPLYWWKEASTYKIGTTANSTSTMHKLATTTPITLECFEIDDLNKNFADSGNSEDDEFEIIGSFLTHLEMLRQRYLETKDKRYWKELIRWLPESWLQTRTVTMSYENLFNICKQRKNHKLNEWSGKDDSTKENFISWARTLPYAQELIFIDELDKLED